MGIAARKQEQACWSDVLDAPEGIKLEVIGGERYETSPRPMPAHGYVQIALGSIVHPRHKDGDGDGGDHDGAWWILVEPDVAIGPHDIVAPDLVGWRRDRVPEFPGERPIRAIPDWVCEVLSPSTAQRDRLIKADLYLRAGVGHYWLADPTARTLEAFTNRDGGWLRVGGWSDQHDARIPPFDAADIDVDTLFPPRPRAAEDATP